MVVSELDGTFYVLDRSTVAAMEAKAVAAAPSDSGDAASAEAIAAHAEETERHQRWGVWVEAPFEKLELSRGSCSMAVINGLR